MEVTAALVPLVPEAAVHLDGLANLPGVLALTIAGVTRTELGRDEKRRL